MNKKLENLQTKRNKLQTKSDKLSKIAERKYAQYEVGDFIPFFMTRAIAEGVHDEIADNITLSAIERPYNTDVANAIHKGACYALSGAAYTALAVGLIPFAALEAPVAAIGCGIEGLKELDRTVYNNRTSKARSKLKDVQEELKLLDEKIAELSSQKVC